MTAAAMPAPIQQPRHLASAGFGAARPAAATLAVATRAVIVLRMTSSKMLRNRSPEHCGLTADRDAAFRWTFRGLGANPYPSNLHSTASIRRRSRQQERTRLDAYQGSSIALRRTGRNRLA